MTADMLREGHETLDRIPQQRLSDVVRWLKLVAAMEENPEVELEELWLLATGELKKMADEAKDEAEPINDWRKYLDEL